MEEQFVPFELSVKLKELGFDFLAFGGYASFYSDTSPKFYKDFRDEFLDYDIVIATPLWQQAWEFLQIRYCFNFKITCYLSYRIEIVEGEGIGEVFESTEQDVVMRKLIELVTNQNKQSNERVGGSNGRWSFSAQKGNKIRGFQAQVWREDGYSLALIEPTENQIEATANAQLISCAPEMRVEIEESIKDLLCIQGSIYESSKIDNRWEGVYDIIQKQIDRKKELINKATTI